MSKSLKKKTITELRKTIFETTDEVLETGKTQIISHKSGNELALVPISKLKDLKDEAELHKNLSIGYQQAIRGEGVSSKEALKKFKEK